MTVKELIDLLQHVDPSLDVRVKTFSRPVLYETIDPATGSPYVCIADAPNRDAQSGDRR